MRLIILFVLLTLLISGCDMITNIIVGKPPTVDVNYNSLHSGVQGISMSFAPDRPQTNYIVMPNGNDITVIIGMENKGAWDVPAGKGILALNYDRTYVDFPDKSKEFSTSEYPLNGRSLIKAKGDKVQVDFNGNILPLKELKKDITINAVACYEYGTEYIFDVCIDTDPTNTRTTPKACDLLQNKKKYNAIGSGQGAPVAITSVDQAIRIKDGKLDIDFIIKIKNVGNGKIYDIDATPAVLCSGGNSLEAADKVTIKVELADKVLTCEKIDNSIDNSKIYVREGLEGIVNCRVTGYSTVNDESFLSKLKVTLTYDYTDSIGKIIILKKAGARV
ncbi:MAG: hypothetical protein AABX51_07640 [Nanoarchaeota archaeon]